MDITLGGRGDRDLRTLDTAAFPPSRKRRATAQVLSPQGRSAVARHPSLSMPGGPTVDESVRALIASHEDERRLIARELHDVVGQALTAIRLHLDLVQRTPGRAAVVAVEVDEARRLVDSALRQVRELAFDIRPPALDDLGLASAARSWLLRQARISGFDADFQADIPGHEPHPEITSACFRTLQEAVTNISRHAAASTVQVSIVATADELVLTVRDNGVGFEPHSIRLGRSHRTLGLLGARERVALVGGSLTIESKPSKGTTFRASFPLVPTGFAGAVR